MSSSGWEVRFSNSRQLPYFYNGESGLSVWEKPEDLSEDQVAALPGAHHLKVGSKNASSNGGGAAPPGTVRASHLLVKHRESRRPSSWKDVSGRIETFGEREVRVKVTEHYCFESS
jgi:NIMA-interacting peptidyl-prolyl cis-trans isomerase 1